MLLYMNVVESRSWGERDEGLKASNFIYSIFNIFLRYIYVYLMLNIVMHNFL